MTDLPYYYEKLRQKSPRASDIAVERAILKGWKREWEENPETCPFWHEEEIECEGEEPVKVWGFVQHALRYQRLIMPNVEINSWIIRMWKAVQATVFQHKRKIANFIGSKNSGKTNFFAIFVHVMVSINPSYTRAFISGPYKSAADSTIWGRIGTRMTNMKAARPGLWESVIDLRSKQRYVYDEKSDEAGYIELITLDKVGKLQGTKSLDQDIGWLILICDEIAEFPSSALLDALDNITGNRNLICLTGCNFKNIEGLEGDLCRPEGREYADLDIDLDQDWASNYKSWTWRFDGHLSPNVKAGKLVSKHLLTEDVRQDMEDIHGLRGPKYLEQVRSFPNSSMSDYFVMTKDKLRASGGYDEFTWDMGAREVVAFCDPGFGGDPCRIGACEFGPARIASIDGEWHTVPVFTPLFSFENIKIDTLARMDDEWARKLREIGTEEFLIKADAAITPEQQIVIGCSEFLKRHNIPVSRFGYDGSMRAGIVHEMVALMGSRIVSLDFGGEATERTVSGGNRPCREVYYNFVSEMYFELAAAMQAGQFRGGDLIPAAIQQLVRRPWTEKGTRKQIQPKKDYKAANQGNSPNDADVLVGCFELARRLGFRSNIERKANSVTLNTNDLIAKIRALPLFNRKHQTKLHPRPL